MTDELLNKKVLRNFVEALPADAIKFYCNACLHKQGLGVPSNYEHHDTGACEGDCNTINDVSVPEINAKVEQLGMRDYTREDLWTDRIFDLKRERTNAFFKREDQSHSTIGSY